MSLKETWNRIAFGVNSTGQKSGLLREFRDTSDPEAFEDLAVPSAGGDISDVDVEGEVEDAEYIPTHGTTEGYDFLFDASDLKTGAIQESAIKSIAGTRGYNLLIEAGLMQNVGGKAQNQGGQRTVIMFIDLIHEKGAGTQTLQTANIAKYGVPASGGSNQVSEVKQQQYTSAQITNVNGSDGTFTSNMDNHYGPFNWGSPDGPGDVVINTEYYELKGKKDFITAEDVKTKNYPFEKESKNEGLPDAGVARKKQDGSDDSNTAAWKAYSGKPLSAAASKCTNTLTKYLLQNVFTGQKEYLGWLLIDPCNVSGNAGSKTMQTGSNLGAPTVSDSAAKTLQNQILGEVKNHLKSSPQAQAAVYQLWAQEQGLNGSNPENLIIGGHKKDSLSCVAIHDLATQPGAGMWRVSTYPTIKGSGANTYRKCRPLVAYKFAAWRLADCPNTEALF